MEEQLYPEEQMQIEIQARNAFLFAAEYGNQGIEHLFSVLETLKERLKEQNEPEQ